MLFNVYANSDTHAFGHWDTVVGAMATELVEHVRSVADADRAFYDADGYAEQVIGFAVATAHAARLALRQRDERTTQQRRRELLERPFFARVRAAQEA